MGEKNKKDGRPELPVYDAASPLQSESGAASAAERPVIALLKAAKPRGLRLWCNLQRVICLTSADPHRGWYPQASWGERAVDWNAGGPWSREFVEYVASLGLIGIWPHEEADKASLTKAGRAYLKALTDVPRSGSAEPAGTPSPGLNNDPFQTKEGER